MTTTRSLSVPLLLTAMVLVALLSGPADAACHIASFDSQSTTVSESDGSVELLVFLVGRQPSCEGTVDWRTVADTAAEGEDFTAASGTLEFTEGDDREETITIELVVDETDEGDESFMVELAEPTGGISGTGDPATITISGSSGAGDAGDDGGDTATGDAGDDGGDTATGDAGDDSGDAATEDDATEGAADQDDDDGGVPVLLIGLVLLAVVVAGGVLAMRRGG